MRLPFVAHRPLCLPVLARMWQPRHPDRQIHAVADAAYAGKALRGLPRRSPSPPWYRTKHAPSLADMLTALRREQIAAQHRPGRQVEPTPKEILQVQAAWAARPHEVRNPRYSDYRRNR